MTDRLPVAACVLTHNAPVALARCLASLAAADPGPARVIVVDNASEPPAIPALPEGAAPGLGLEVVRLDHNGGPAGGHAAGLARFAATGLEAAWVMDDDTEVAPDCLAHLWAAHTTAPGPTVWFPVCTERPSGRRLATAGWVGVLVPAAAVARAGLPDERLFWWAEDTEYLRERMKAHGIPQRIVEEARTTHEAARSVGERPAWKAYYEARNVVYLRRHVQRDGPAGRRARRAVTALAKLTGQITLRERQKARKLGLLARGVADGWRGRLGETIPVQAREVPARAAPAHVPAGGAGARDAAVGDGGSGEVRT